LYSRRQGGFLCARCAGSDSGGIERHYREDLLELPAGAFAWLEAASGATFGDAVRVGLGREALAALKACVLDLARKAVESPLRTLDSGIV
jgi:hypothetical protein